MRRVPRKGLDVSLIQAQGLGVRTGGRQILRDVDLSVRKREIVTVVGPNGSGKTTLLRVLIGAQAPSEGAVVREAGLRVGYVPQRLAIDQAMPLTVARWLALSGIKDRQEHLQIAEQVGILGLLKQQMFLPVFYPG